MIRGRAPTVAPRDIAALAEACRDGQAVRFGYRRRDGEPSRRRVEPNALVTVRNVWYLIGYDLDRADWRLFRVDRMQDVEVTGHGTSRRALPGGDAMEFLAASLADMPYPFNAAVEIGRPADAVLDAPRLAEPASRRCPRSATLPAAPRCRLRRGPRRGAARRRAARSNDDDRCPTRGPPAPHRGRRGHLRRRHGMMTSLPT